MVVMAVGWHATLRRIRPLQRWKGSVKIHMPGEATLLHRYCRSKHKEMIGKYRKYIQLEHLKLHAQLTTADNCWSHQLRAATWEQNGAKLFTLGSQVVHFLRS